MTEYGEIVKIKGELATVRIGRHSACASCGKCGMTTKQKHVDVSVINTLDAKVGDNVKLDLKEGNTVKLALFAYVLPLVIAFLLFGLGVLLKLPEWASVIMFVGGLVIAFIIIWRVDKHKRNTNFWAESPVMVEIVIENTQNEQSIIEKDTNI